MFIKNTVKTDIGPVSAQDGYEFIIPAGKVCAITEEAGQHLIELYKVRGEGGTALPPVIEATRKQWDGRSYAIVTRFQMKPGLIPSRTDLLEIARKRGVDKDTIEKFTRDESLDNEEIVRVINELPVSEEIRFPESPDEEEKKPKVKKEDEE